MENGNIASSTDLRIKLSNANIVFEVLQDSNLILSEKKNLKTDKISILNRDDDCLCDCEEICKNMQIVDKLDIENDQDGDGVNDVKEAEYGTDPKNVDSDGDGYSDLEEIENGYNPLGSGKNIEKLEEVEPVKREKVNPFGLSDEEMAKRLKEESLGVNASDSENSDSAFTKLWNSVSSFFKRMGVFISEKF